MTALITAAAIILASWLGVAFLVAWGHAVWGRHLSRLEAYARHPATRHLLDSLTEPGRDDPPADTTTPRRRGRVRRFQACDCDGTLHDWSGVIHTPTRCMPTRERV